MSKNSEQTPDDKLGKRQKPALPKKWIVPIKLAVMSALACCSAFVYFNVHDLQITQMLILGTIVMVCAMVWMDCKMSERYWNEQEHVNRNANP